MANEKIKPQNDVQSEPVSLATARLHLRLDLVGSPPAHPDDALVEALITAAREDAEKYLGIAVALQTYKVAFDAFPTGSLHLGLWPVSEVESITYVDANGATQTLSSGAYALDVYAKPALVHAVGEWPRTKDVPNAVIVTVRAGFTDGVSPNEYPAPKAINQAILLLIGHLYEHRESVNVGQSVTTYPLGYLHLLTGHRINMGM